MKKSSVAKYFSSSNKDINTVNNGVKYYFCNNGCKGKFEAAPEVSEGCA